ncbi:murein DD-endopeptidase MepM [Haemophilus paraphrohaemolyticus]|uniref:Murein DD-endopeptidase MepM n=1 Tax=Haemophilus paraphrohaemolyticus TaxID=736 RepID=A0A369ZQD9_9PAST|nr:murein DD-endopeptidase MepM [Haemophilus paraphrohaemolyticus]RDF11836.1 murein DD-endopeptidase MepM [Haemophilus paraphrohaemolyticus]
MAVLSIGIGIALSLKKQTPLNASSQENVIILDDLDNDIVDDVESTNSDTEQAEKKQDLTEDPNATSYDDELASEDDEEEGKEGKPKVAQEKLPEEAELLISDIVNIADEALRIQDQFSYVVIKGDKLSDVLEQSGLGDDDAKALIRQYPALGKLEAGQQFYWVLDNFGELEYLNWLVSEKEERIYERQENGKFSYQSIEKKGVWRQDVIKGAIQGSFTTSLRNVGLSDRQINQLAVGLQSQIATSKLKNGDRFAILVRQEYINDTVTDIGNVEGILIENGKKRYYAIQASNGRYYSNHGETLTKGFARQPLLFTARVSSPFNPRRLHPITKRVRPHNGVDFGVPTGTPIIAPSDGVVEHVAFQAHGAGRYIKIRHGHITTVYMHLSKPLVKPGQTVRKGERIALSGNSGGSTGPHLHYEFHINGRPVNPMTVKLPGSGSDMASKERKNFLERAKNVQEKLKL